MPARVSWRATLLQPSDDYMTTVTFDLLRSHSRRISTSCSPTASRGAGDAVHGLVQQGRAAAGARRFASRIWRLFSDLDLSEAQKTRFHKPARLLHARAEGGRAARSIPIPRAGQPLRRASSAPAARSPTARCCRSRAFPTRWPSCSAIRRWSTRYRNGALRHAAADLEHVSPLPRARMTARRAGDLHFRRHLERQSDRAQAHRAAVLQERARGHRSAGWPTRPADHAGAGRGHPGRQHPAAFPRRAAAPEVPGAERIACDARLAKGEEMGWFEHGSTIIVFAPPGMTL